MFHCLTYTCCTPLTKFWQSKIFVIYIYIYVYIYIYMHAAGTWLENKFNMHTDLIKNQLNYLTDKNDLLTCTQMNWILLYALRKFPMASIAESVYVIILYIKQLTNPTLKWFDSYEFQVIMIFQYVGAVSGCLYSWLHYALPYLKLITWKELKLLIVILINEVCAPYKLYLNSYLLSHLSAVSIVIYSSDKLA